MMKYTMVYITYPLYKDDKVYLKYKLDLKPHEGSIGNVTLYINDKEVVNENITSYKIKKDKHSFLDWIHHLW